ncbi:class I SAM-dependent methyltransferase [Chitinilyticum piscinae]|uniref:class I SAM-dependent methyltransferase n=1 Tax=Chitinilyticum piscinae TaxID=2866724 RepID=UPI0027E43EDB|nr:class I SAM-dependent methyltransferase [Chitinilyticum piscinae]
MSCGLIREGADSAVLALAEAYGLPLWESWPADADSALFWQEGALVLCRRGEKGVVGVDFAGGASAHRRKFGGGAGQPVARAIGVKGDYRPRILDATAGQGRDAFVLASLGCSVTLVERHPVAAALLADGLARAAVSDDDAVRAIAARMTLVHRDALGFLQEAAGRGERWDVVFLDPMFPEPDKRAKVKKEMAAFQTLIGGDRDADALLIPARHVAGKRVVVKRPKLAPFLAGAQPSFQYPGESTRFDAYLPLGV